MSERKVSHAWAPLEDLPPDWICLTSFELQALSRVWQDQRERLQQTNGGALERFNTELNRQWSIETGIIEGLYNLNRGITQLLIEKGIDAALISTYDTNRSPEAVAVLIKDHEDTIEGLFDFVKGTRVLTTGYVKELHASLVRHQPYHEGIDSQGHLIRVPLEAGVYKLRPNSPLRPDGSLHEYCPPEHVSAEMDRLIALHGQHSFVPPEVESAWLHHRFTQIHPFEDGNGRVARCLATLVFLKADGFPLVVTRDERDEYISALELADRGELRALVDLFSRLQRRALLRALTISSTVLEQGKVSLAIDALKGDLLQRQQGSKSEFLLARDHCNELLEVARNRFDDVRTQLENIGDILGPHSFAVDVNDNERRARLHHFEVSSTARKIGYFANMSDFHLWLTLLMQTDHRGEILLSFHDLGHQFRGVCAVSACFFLRESTAEGQSEILDVSALTDDLFQVNYLEPIETVRARFSSWLEEVLLRGIDAWRRVL